MDNRDFELLVERAERTARARPGAYKAQVFGLAVLGYAFLAALIAVLVTVIGVAMQAIRHVPGMAIKLVIVLGAFLLVVLRALWVVLEPPAGRILIRSDAPDLFKLLDGLCQELQTPPIHRVLLTPEFNAALAQVPRLGLFGWHRNYLVLGLPLMQVLSREQFTAVLAHELGHLSLGHARTSNWIYRMRQTWLRLEDALIHHGPPGSQVINWFYRWYVPYFFAFSFPLARANEFEADEAAARLTSSQAACQALTNVNVVGAFLSERYWPGLYRAALDAAPQTAFAPYTKLGTAVLIGISEADRKAWMSAALKEVASVADTHPSLQERIYAMGGTPEVAVPAPGQAADLLLRPALPRLLTEFDQHWHKRLAQWREEQGQKQQSQQKVFAPPPLR
jgi:Zn-dependent protease with chaperone function